MGHKRNHPYEFPLTITVRLHAPNEQEALARAEDVVVAIRERWAGRELYRPFDGGPRRLTGHPRIERMEGGPVQDVAHEDAWRPEAV